MQVAIDSSVLVGLLNPNDLWHAQALDLRDALLAAHMTVVYFDCVVAEAISTAALPQPAGSEALLNSPASTRTSIELPG